MDRAPSALFAMPIIKGSDQLSVCIVTFENIVRRPQVR